MYVHTEIKFGVAAWLWCACFELGNMGSNSWSRSGFILLDGHCCYVWDVSAFTAIVFQVSLVETTIDKVSCTAVLVVPTDRNSPGRYGNYSIHCAS